MRDFIRDRVRPIALTLIAPVLGILIIFVVELFIESEISKLLISVVNLIVVAIVAFRLFPTVLGIPFGKIETRQFLRKLGFYLPPKAWKHVLLGVILAGCTLSGMLVASILTGKYSFDVSTINLPHIVFSLNPGLWEELFYRGVLMILLLRFTKSFNQAFLIQLVLFGLGHIKGSDIWAMIDVFSVIVLAVGYTYTAYKTQSLVAGIVSHYFHDVFLFTVQLTGDIYRGTGENVLFFGLLWLMVGVGCIITKLATDKIGVRAPTELYTLENV